MAHRIINNEAERAEYIRFVQSASLPRTFEDTPGRDRTKDQNALQWLWATEAANQLGDRTAEEVRHDWKLRHGVPILREDSAAFREIYDSAIKPLPYELKVASMAFIPVTSEMKVRQMVRYLDAVQRECLEQGLRLTDPDPALASYQSRYRQKPASGDRSPKGGDRGDGLHAEHKSAVLPEEAADAEHFHGVSKS